MNELAELQNFILKDDALYKECIRLATNSKGKMRFGSVLIKDGKTIGKGWNRRTAGRSKELQISMGYANHAEVESMNNAVMEKYDINNSRIYVAGYFHDGSLYIPKYPSFTCTSCPRYFEKYGINEIFVPLYSGWERLFLNEAIETAKSFYGNSHNKRIDVGKSNLTVDMITI